MKKTIGVSSVTGRIHFGLEIISFHIPHFWQQYLQAYH